MLSIYQEWNDKLKSDWTDSKYINTNAQYDICLILKVHLLHATIELTKMAENGKC